MKAQFKLIGFFLILLAIFSVVCFGVVSLSVLTYKAIIAESLVGLLWGVLAIPFYVQCYQWAGLIYTEYTELDLY